MAYDGSWLPLAEQNVNQLATNVKTSLDLSLKRKRGQSRHAGERQPRPIPSRWGGVQQCRKSLAVPCEILSLCPSQCLLPICFPTIDLGSSSFILIG
jgi:hypothetical protein